MYRPCMAGAPKCSATTRARSATAASRLPSTAAKPCWSIWERRRSRDRLFYASYKSMLDLICVFIGPGDHARFVDADGHSVGRFRSVEQGELSVRTTHESMAGGPEAVLVAAGNHALVIDAFGRDCSSMTKEPGESSIGRPDITVPAGSTRDLAFVVDTGCIRVRVPLFLGVERCDGTVGCTNKTLIES